MAESQLVCMEDGHIPANVPESKPEFYYSEEQRAALEQLLRNGDGAFKMRLKEDKVRDFLSAREIKSILSTFKVYTATEEENDSPPALPRAQATSASAAADPRVPSTYWPQLSDTEVPPLDIGWPSGGFFRGVTRVAVHTHPPKDNGPHVKEVVRRLIQEASKVIAIVMDLLTDLHILQDLMDAAGRRSVPVYILLDARGVPHFLDMCARLQIGAQQLQNIRARSLQGSGFSLSFGKLPGSLCNKYMLVDGDKVMFGSYSFSWCSSRMDRNMITVMTGQVVDFYDRDFRELYAVSDDLDLYAEFHVSPPARKDPPADSKVGPKRPAPPAATSRFQVSLGDNNPGRAGLQVPAHKYYNPKYFLAFGDPQGPSEVLAPPSDGGREAAPGGVAGGEEPDRLSPLPSEAAGGGAGRPNGALPPDKKPLRRLRFPRQSRPSRKNSLDGALGSSRCPSPAETGGAGEGEGEGRVEVMVKRPSRWWKRKPSSKMGPKSESVQSVDARRDSDSMKSQPRSKASCAQS